MPCRWGSPWNCEALDAFSSATALRGRAGIPGPGRPSRFRPKRSPPLRRGKPSKSACNPAPPRRGAPGESHARGGGDALTGRALQPGWLVHTGQPPWWGAPVPPAVPGTRRRREARERSAVMAQSTALRDAAVDLQVVREFLERYFTIENEIKVLQQDKSASVRNSKAGALT